MLHMDTRRGDAESYNAIVGAQLRAEIAAAGMSVAEAARRSGIPRQTLIRYLDGQREIPVPILYRIGALVDVTPGSIIERAGDRYSKTYGLGHVLHERQLPNA